MVSIRWCLKQRDGLKIVEPNENMSASYVKMAEESILVLSGVSKSRIWTATAAYYIFYYSLYALMLRIGIKCEVHACSLEFMKRGLNGFYDNKDMQMIQKSFNARINLQYYADRPVDESSISETKNYCKDFFIKTKDILSRIKEKEIEEIRGKLERT